MKSCDLPDTQNNEDTRQIVIDKVGIKDIAHPITYVDRNGNRMPTVGNFTMTVTLPEHVKGTHMSRFIEILNDGPCEFNSGNFDKIINKVREKLESDTAHITLDFPFFRKKAAPSSGVESMMDYQVTLYGVLDKGESEVMMKVVVPVTSLCPCSKSISKYGAHNQRSHITIKAKVTKGKTLYIEDLIDLAERKASCELYAILKREDEKVVTERAYDNPAFVEDLVRDIAVELNSDEKISYYRLESENFESIHNHSAYALIENQK
ncbi:MAG TPA: GTP cyclohydrolase I FolE2 [Gammaproteobacteria bacterium]|jgi:GTP cyclohydrolase I|nr:GTP cyclohydrolase I FolE2 [Gammaproteobacteria bacterium]HAE72680.1 GTP cyclohydrolase I FolE2 [Gammaproteobacteria bacterium]HAO70539.1 GTP cyclohydrolase I FolE2 [Gammaproteobacteria bacterium]HAO90355.1 GTP cyclohydrolase I FolE2 [Gammaproteobacteria bacterium]HAP05908.1 GTP cyclohydrolase I FolE2 [Gammaproteobacteria bacterium]